MDKLEFLTTVSADEFKAAQGVNKLDILRNETTGKCFFQYGSKNGAVTSKYPQEPLTEPMVSEVMSNTGATFFLLHNRSEIRLYKTKGFTNIINPPPLILQFDNNEE